jgi:fibronectin type III domain protein
MRALLPPFSSRRRRTTLVLLATLAAASTFGISISASAAVAHNPNGNVDAIWFKNGVVRVKGTAYDPDTKASINVRIVVNSRAITVPANIARGDFARQYPAWGPNHGFDYITPMANGSYQICVIALNVGAGANRQMRCSTIVVNNNPTGAVTSVVRIPGGLQFNGWAIDPNVTTAIQAMVVVDGSGTGQTADRVVPGLSTPLGSFGTTHGFSISVPVKAGVRKPCIRLINVGAGANTTLWCSAVTLSSAATGQLLTVNRTSATSMSVTGWALDPDVLSPTTVEVSIDGTILATLAANAPSAKVPATYSAFGANHGFSKSFTVDGNEHSVCMTALNAASTPGTDAVPSCAPLYSAHPTVAGAPTGLQVWPGNTTATVSWLPPASDGGAPITGYVLKLTPGGTVSLDATRRQATLMGLRNGTRYTFTIQTRNAIGLSAGALSPPAVPSPIPPQFTPAPVSTSHYLRNLTGNFVSDAALMKRMGAYDAAHDPSGHRYLILLQIGGQDMSRGGVLLSATSKFVTNAGVVNATKAYLDGYASAQKRYAPMLLAIGTNNDVDVSAAAGTAWADRVVDPVRAYAARYPGITVGGANDMEPGFSATVAETQSWLTGYLRATSAQFVFNGSADGCSTVTYNSRCNNGWNMAALQWLSGGAAPSRTVNLPQIYNNAMPLQWKFISVTGVKARKPRLYFGGPLTEFTACDQAGSCGSLSNVVAWQKLWAAISSSPVTKQYDMPHGTDLRIN